MPLDQIPHRPYCRLVGSPCDNQLFLPWTSAQGALPSALIHIVSVQKSSNGLLTYLLYFGEMKLYVPCTAGNSCSTWLKLSSQIFFRQNSVPTPAQKMFAPYNHFKIIIRYRFALLQPPTGSGEQAHRRWSSCA